MRSKGNSLFVLAMALLRNKEPKTGPFIERVQERDYYPQPDVHNEEVKGCQPKYQNEELSEQSSISFNG